MPRNRTGSQVALRASADGAFELRFCVDGRRQRVVLHAQPGCGCGCGGGWDEVGARTELHNILARVRVGTWRPPDRLPQRSRRRKPSRTPTFERYATDWLQAKIDGTSGASGAIAPSTADLYRSQLAVHLLPFFGHRPVAEIDRDACLEFKTHKLRQAHEIREALTAGADLRDRYGRRAMPLSASSVKRLIDLLGMILDEAAGDGLITTNPARGKRMRLKVPRPPRPALEIDDLAALLDAAAEQDQPVRPVIQRADLGPTTRLVEHLLTQGRRPHQIAQRLGVSRSTVSWHLRRLDAVGRQPYAGRCVVCELLGRAGLRASELSELRVGDVRLDELTHAHLLIREAKTDAGVREVQMTPQLVEVVTAHLHRLHQAGLPTGPDAYLVPNSRGGAISRKRIAGIVLAAVERACEHQQRRGLPPLPSITPHALRRTYISIALLANGFDVKWVMRQVGHTDSKMTMDVYAQLVQRIHREHGANFDALLAAAGSAADGVVAHGN
jgi:integrase